MLKFDIEYLKFEDLKDGDVFLIQGEGYTWYGMKVSETCQWEENKSYERKRSRNTGKREEGGGAGTAFVSEQGGNGKVAR